MVFEHCEFVNCALINCKFVNHGLVDYKFINFSLINHRLSRFRNVNHIDCFLVNCVLLEVLKSSLAQDCNSLDIFLVGISGCNIFLSINEVVNTIADL